MSVSPPGTGSGTLLRKAIKGAGWVLVRMASRQVTNAALFFWLVTQLTPTEIGIATLAILLPVFLLPLTRNGLREVLIQRDDLQPEDLDTAFTLSCLLGVTISCLLFASAPLLGRAFDEGPVMAMTQVASLIPLLGALGMVHEAQLERRFAQKKVTFVHFGTALVALVCAVVVALSGAPLWALVTFNVVSYALMSLTYWLTEPWRPQGIGRLAEARRQMRMALPIMVSKLIAMGNQRIAEMVLVVLLTPAALAFFRFGVNFSRLINQLFIAPVIQILLPAFARSAAEPLYNLRRTLAINGMVVFPLSMIVALLLPDVVALAFGENWAEGALVGAILCFSVYTTLLTNISNTLLLSEGKADWALLMVLLVPVTILLFVPFGALYGTVGAALAYVIRGVVMVPAALWILRRAVGFAPREVFVAFAPFALGGLVLYALLFLGQQMLEGVVARSVLAVVGMALLYPLWIRGVIKVWQPETYALLAANMPARLKRFA